MTKLVRDFELLLMHRHRFALSNVILCMQRVVHNLDVFHRNLNSVFVSSTVPLEHISRRLEHLVTLVPSFLCEREVATLMTALRKFVRLSQELEPYPKLYEVVITLVDSTRALAQAVNQDAAVCALLTKKRDYLVRFLDQAGQVLQNSHSRRVQEYQNAIENFTMEFQLTLKDKHLQRAKQLRFDIDMIETSISTMLLPHFEICRTIITANAQVQATGSTYSKSESKSISAFVQIAAKLKSGDITFCSVLQDAVQFLAQLSLFEQAASKDAFFVCSSALKLQFRESLDQELFLAYVEDWNDKRKALQRTESRSEFQAATDRLQELRSAIKRAHECAQTNQEKLVLDDPVRESLAQEVARIFHAEGGQISQLDLPGCE